MKYLIANHKMNFTTAELTAYLKKLKKYAKKSENYVGICVPYVYLPLATKMCRKTNIHVGAQDMYFEAKGPYTGEISATMLKDFNTELVILGHSERRGIFGEKDESVNKKVLVALNEGLTPQQVSQGSNKKVWWQCRNEHVWRTAVFMRTRNGEPKGVECPTCRKVKRIEKRVEELPKK